MNFKKTWKRFMNMSRSREGFTLVELIVVIAILAILAGVAIPVYSGYISKANEAADQQLLGVLNTAFGAACLENNMNAQDLTNATLTYGGSAGAVTVTGVATVNGAANANVNASFKTYFAGNETSTFKVIERLVFDTAKGIFVDLNSVDSVTVTFGGEAITLSSAQVQALANSTFGTAIGSELLLGKVDSVSNIASGLLNGPSYSVIDQLIYGTDINNPDNEAYLTALAGSLNMTYDELTDEMDKMETMEEYNQFLANSLVLTAATNTQGLDTSFLGTTGFADQLQADLDNPAKANTALAQAAMAYGMYTSYANSSYGTDEMKNKVNNLETGSGFIGLTDMLGDLEDPKFQEYLKSDEGKADLNAYQSAMDLINDATQESSSAAMDVLMNGFTDPELSSLLTQVMGK